MDTGFIYFLLNKLSTNTSNHLGLENSLPSGIITIFVLLFLYIHVAIPCVSYSVLADLKSARLNRNNILIGILAFHSCLNF